MDYFSRLFPSREDGVSFNRVPYTFDVSLFDIIGALPFGYTLFSLESEHEQSMRDTFEALRESGMTAWISTGRSRRCAWPTPASTPSFCRALTPSSCAARCCATATALKLWIASRMRRCTTPYGPTETRR